MRSSKWITSHTHLTNNSKNFKKWFEGSKVVDESGEPLVVYHGTTHDFGEFKYDNANPENWHGTGFYFSNSVEDVNRNYGTMEGADLTNRIELIAERRVDDIMDEQNIDDWDEAMEIARSEAQQEVSGESPNVMPVYVKLEKPAVIGGDNPEWLEYRYFDEEGEYLDEPEGEGAELFDALREAIYDNAYDGDSADEIIMQVQEEIGEEFTLDSFEKALRKNETFSMLDNEEGQLINHEVISDTYSKAGYDGVIFHNADEQFSNMGMNPDTTHYVVFEPNKIKSINNKGAFSKDGNILKSAMIVPAVGAGGLAMQQDEEQ